MHNYAVVLYSSLQMNLPLGDQAYSLKTFLEMSLWPMFFDADGI
jgi:hypothetical protein